MSDARIPLDLSAHIRLSASGQSEACVNRKRESESRSAARHGVCVGGAVMCAILLASTAVAGPSSAAADTSPRRAPLRETRWSDADGRVVLLLTREGRELLVTWSAEGDRIARGTAIAGHRHLPDAASGNAAEACPITTQT